MLVFSSRQGIKVMIRDHDDVAEWDGGAWGPEQRLDEAYGHRPQGASAPRLSAGLHGQNSKPVSFIGNEYFLIRQTFNCSK